MQWSEPCYPMKRSAAYLVMVVVVMAFLGLVLFDSILAAILASVALGIVLVFGSIYYYPKYDVRFAPDGSAALHNNRIIQPAAVTTIRKRHDSPRGIVTVTLFLELEDGSEMRVVTENSFFATKREQLEQLYMFVKNTNIPLHEEGKDHSNFLMSRETSLLGKTPALFYIRKRINAQ